TYNLTNSATCKVLANFIQRAKQTYGITQVGAIGENFFFFNNVIQIYNQQHSNPLQKFDVYNIEFEFWNTTSVSSGNYYCTTYLQPGGYSCDTAGAFSFYKTLIRQVDSIGNLIGVFSEAYVGWFNQGQAITIANTVDRILLHDYISNYSSLYSYIQQRLQFIAARNLPTKVIAIFSAETSFMGPWLTTHNVLLPYTDLQTYLANETGNWVQYISLVGYQWFAYSFMPYHLATSYNPHFLDNSLKIYPNPANDLLNIHISNPAVNQQVVITDLLGNEIYSQLIKNQDTHISISNWSSGIYFYEITNDSETTRGKFIKQ
ncbi:MAG: T9SS type A sorting domain-containing protein, partial [Bacteroidota bacterium]